MEKALYNKGISERHQEWFIIRITIVLISNGASEPDEDCLIRRERNLKMF